jgi:hypothetical protein
MRLPVTALIALALAACAHVPLSAQPGAIARHADELAARGHAEIEVEEGGTAHVASADRISVRIPGNEQSYLWGLVTTGSPDRYQDLTIGSFVAGCGPAGGPDCLARRLTDPIHIGTRRVLDPTRVGIGVFGAITTAMGVFCLASCQRHSDAAYVGTGLAVATLLYALSTLE